LDLGDVHAVTLPDHTQGPEAIKENPPLPNEVSSVPAQDLVNDNSPVPLQGSAAQHGETTCTQLVSGKKYQVRPAPSGGFGIYEGRSLVLMQLFAKEDDARDAINSVIPTTTCPKCGKVTVKVIKIAGATRYWHELEGRQRKHRGCIVKEPEPTPEPEVTVIELTPTEIAWLRRNVKMHNTLKYGGAMITNRGIEVYTHRIEGSGLTTQLLKVIEFKGRPQSFHLTDSIIAKIQAATEVEK